MYLINNVSFQIITSMFIHVELELEFTWRRHPEWSHTNTCNIEMVRRSIKHLIFKP